MCIENISVTLEVSNVTVEGWVVGLEREVNLLAGKFKVTPFYDVFQEFLYTWQFRQKGVLGIPIKKHINLSEEIKINE